MHAAFGKDGWVDDRLRIAIGSDEWNDLVENQLESGALPELHLPDGSVVCQSHVIARWAAAMARENSAHDLYPSDPTKAMLVDEVVAFAHEVLEKAPNGRALGPGESLKEKREAFMNGGFLQKACDLLERRLDAVDSPFFGDVMTIADLCATGLVRMILSGQFDHIPAEWMANGYPKLVAMAEATDASELAQSYYAAIADEPWKAELKVAICILKMMNFALKMVHSVFKMMN